MRMVQGFQGLVALERFSFGVEHAHACLQPLALDLQMVREARRLRRDRVLVAASKRGREGGLLMLYAQIGQEILSEQTGSPAANLHGVLRAMCLCHIEQQTLGAYRAKPLCQPVKNRTRAHADSDDGNEIASTMWGDAQVALAINQAGNVGSLYLWNLSDWLRSTLGITFGFMLAIARSPVLQFLFVRHVMSFRWCRLCVHFTTQHAYTLHLWTCLDEDGAGIPRFGKFGTI